MSNDHGIFCSVLLFFTSSLTNRDVVSVHAQYPFMQQLTSFRDCAASFYVENGWASLLAKFFLCLIEMIIYCRIGYMDSHSVMLS